MSAVPTLPVSPLSSVSSGGNNNSKAAFGGRAGNNDRNSRADTSAARTDKYGYDNTQNNEGNEDNDEEGGDFSPRTLSALLVSQEMKYDGRNMFSTLRQEDEEAMGEIMRSGKGMHAALLIIFERKMRGEWGGGAGQHGHHGHHGSAAVAKAPSPRNMTSRPSNSNLNPSPSANSNAAVSIDGAMQVEKELMLLMQMGGYTREQAVDILLSKNAGAIPTPAPAPIPLPKPSSNPALLPPPAPASTSSSAHLTRPGPTRGSSVRLSAPAHTAPAPIPSSNSSFYGAPPPSSSYSYPPSDPYHAGGGGGGGYYNPGEYAGAAGGGYYGNEYAAGGGGGSYGGYDPAYPQHSYPSDPYAPPPSSYHPAPSYPSSSYPTYDNHPYDYPPQPYPSQQPYHPPRDPNLPPLLSSFSPDERALHLGIILSEQESMYGVNMIESMGGGPAGPADYDEMNHLKAEGYEDDDAMLIIFQNKVQRGDIRPIRNERASTSRSHGGGGMNAQAPHSSLDGMDEQMREAMRQSERELASRPGAVSVKGPGPGPPPGPGPGGYPMQRAPSGSSQPPPSYPLDIGDPSDLREEDMVVLESMGFSRAQSAHALRVHGYDMFDATNYLLGNQ